MSSFKVLSKKDIKPLVNSLKERFDYDLNTDMAFFESAKSKIYIVNREVANLPIDYIRINTIGLYFAEKIDKHGRDVQYRLSMEGAQIVGRQATKNIIDLDEEEKSWWFAGLDFDKDWDNGFVLLRYNGLILGCGQIKDNRLLNYVPKVRRMKL